MFARTLRGVLKPFGSGCAGGGLDTAGEEVVEVGVVEGGEEEANIWAVVHVFDKGIRALEKDGRKVVCETEKVDGLRSTRYGV